MYVVVRMTVTMLPNRRPALCGKNNEKLIPSSSYSCHHIIHHIIHHIHHHIHHHIIIIIITSHCYITVLFLSLSVSVCLP
jgi:hypothetical protein